MQTVFVMGAAYKRDRGCGQASFPKPHKTNLGGMSGLPS
jgi:hypothetical protein